MAYFDPKQVSMETAVEAHQMLGPYTEEKMREISPGGAAFYIWVNSFLTITLIFCQ